MTAANSNTTQVLPDQRVPIIDRYRRWTPAWWRFMKPLLESVNRTSENLVAVSEDLTTARAEIATERTVRANADSALSSQITSLSATLTAADTTLNAAIQNEISARVSGDGANASAISSLTTTVNDNSASISTLTSSVNGISAKYLLTVNINGRVTGIELAGSAASTVFTILADRFRIMRPDESGSPVSIFEAGTVNGSSSVGISGNVIIDGSLIARNIAAAAITAEKIEAGAVTASKIAADAVTADKIAAGTITASKIAAEAVTAEKLSVSSLSSITANVGTLTAGVLQSTDGLMLLDLNNKIFRMSSS